MTGWRKRQVAAQSEQDMPKIGCVNHDCAQCKAQPEQKRPQNCGTGYCSCIDCVMEPEQEPVEWGVDWGPDGNSVSIIKRLSDGNIEVLAWEYAPHPTQRTWVGLMRGVRVEGDTVVISVKGGNEAARELCGQLINEMEMRYGND